MSKEPVQVVWISDTHVGSTVGLSPCHWKIDEDNIHKASKSQLALYKFWTQFWLRRKKDGRPMIVILGGDLVDGDHHSTLQLWTNDELIQVDAAVDLLKPIVNTAKKAYLLRGTTAHVGQSGRFDSLVARELGIPAFYHLRLNVDNVIFDLAHHGPNIGKRTWNLGNSVRNYGRSIVMANMMQGRTPSQVIIRGHVHRMCHETIRDGNHTTEVLIAPSWQLKSEYAYRVDTENDLSDIGGVVVGVFNGKMTDVTFDTMQFEQSESVSVR